MAHVQPHNMSIYEVDRIEIIHPPVGEVGYVDVRFHGPHGASWERFEVTAYTVNGNPITVTQTNRVAETAR